MFPLQPMGPTGDGVLESLAYTEKKSKSRSLKYVLSTIAANVFFVVRDNPVVPRRRLPALSSQSRSRW